MNLTPALKELLSLHEIFRRLGFLPGHLYVDLYGDGPIFPGKTHANFVLRRDGPQAEAEFTINIFEDCSELTPEIWAEAATWWNSATQDQMKEVFERSSARENQTALCFALAKKGLTPTSAELNPEWKA